MPLHVGVEMAADAGGKLRDGYPVVGTSKTGDIIGIKAAFRPQVGLDLKSQRHGLPFMILRTDRRGWLASAPAPAPAPVAVDDSNVLSALRHISRQHLLSPVGEDAVNASK